MSRRSTAGVLGEADRPRARIDAYRRSLQLGLGVLWLLDAALQYQPYMFTTKFPHEVIAATAAGNPGWVAHPVRWAASMMADHRLLANGSFATIQLLIALGLFARATTRVALAGSIVWALLVWWLGEGLGGSLAGPQSPISGFPGAALLYAVAAVFLWPPRRADAGEGTLSVAASSPAGRVLTALAWLALWGSFGYELLRGANRSPSALHGLFVDLQMVSRAGSGLSTAPPPVRRTTTEPRSRSGWPSSSALSPSR
jgi:hypothetical protein